MLHYWHTLRHLKAIQIVGRARLFLPYADAQAGPPPPRRNRVGEWCRPAARPPLMEGPNSFRFLNRSGTIDGAADWNGASSDRLWLYNLHYFDDLNAEASPGRVAWHGALISRWVRENEAGTGIGWEPYPLSLRIVNWIKWSLAGNALPPDAVHSLAVQVRFLRNRLEWHLLGNHLLANAKALIFAGAFFAGEEADSWRDAGLKILDQQYREQVLADGGHFELSPMYHSLVQEDLLDLVNLARVYPDAIPERMVDAWISTLQRMRGWLLSMIHPDGEISFFNDAAQGIAASPSELDAYARRLGLKPGEAPGDGVTHLAESGYIRVQQGDFVAFLDVGRVGPDYLPGHAHADTLSFELSRRGRRVIVNSGTSLYEAGPERLAERSTAAHNTVVVDEENSSEVWKSFRVARRAEPADLSIEQEGDELSVTCGHDGYRRLPGDVTHDRTWRFRPDGVMIEDRLEGRFSSAASYFHLHPDAGLSAGKGRIDCPGGGQLVYRVENGSPQPMNYAYHPQFGLSVGAQCLKVEFGSARCAVSVETA